MSGLNYIRTVVAGALGEYVHGAGVSDFLHVCEFAGLRKDFLSPSVPVEQMIEAAKRENADLVGISSHLTQETSKRLVNEFAEEIAGLHKAGVCFAFGGTPPVAE